MAKISISHLTPDVQNYYALALFGAVWREQGHQVEFGHEYVSDAQICLLHHDKTRLSRDELPVAPAGVKTLNGDVLDISKRLYSTLSLTPGNDWTGPVMVKSNLNHFGMQEGHGLRLALAARVRKRLSRHSWRLARMLPDRYYPVVNSLNDVPGWVWKDSNLIVEKFMPEYADDGLYCVRGWIFFGDQGYAYRSISTEPMVKATSVVRSEFLDSVPPELVSLRESMKFDFGKFDYVEHDGRAILLDANKTPTYPRTDGTITPRMRCLAEGIEVYL